MACVSGCIFCFGRPGIVMNVHGQSQNSEEQKKRPEKEALFQLQATPLHDEHDGLPNAADHITAASVAWIELQLYARSTCSYATCFPSFARAHPLAEAARAGHGKAGPALTLPTVAGDKSRNPV